MITLYYAAKTCSLASHIALELAGAEYEARFVDFSKQEQRSAEFLRLNPKGRVPALVTPRGTLTETPAILAFVAHSYPDAALAPLADAFAFAEVQAFNSYLCSTVHPAHAHRTRGHRWADDPAAIAEMKRKAPEVFADCLKLIEREYLRGPWVMGESFTICDVYLFTVAQWIESDGIDPAAVPLVADHRRRVGELPGVARVVAEEVEQAFRVRA